MPSSSVASATVPVSDTHPKSASRPRSVFLRLHWMLLGGAALATCALLLFRGETSIVSIPSVAMWAVAVSMIAARWVDITRFHGLTADGEPATRGHFRRYALGVAAATAGLWATALAVG